MAEDEPTGGHRLLSAGHEQWAGSSCDISLTGQQRRVVSHERSWLRVVGGPGTGKTEALIAACVKAVEQRGSAAVLGLVHSRAAAREWQARIARGVNGMAPEVMTAHALALRIVSRSSDAASEPLPRLLTAPEQEARVRELLAGSRHSRVMWPESWKEAMVTRGFARQLRAAIARMRVLGLDPEDVAREARSIGDTGWQAVAEFAIEYLDVLGWENVCDYPELMLRACRYLEAGSGAGWSAVFVDDAQELDDLQWRLLHSAGRWADRVVVSGSPNETVSSFRGAQPQRFAPAELPMARSIVLARAFRTPVAVRDAAAAALGGHVAPGLLAEESSEVAAPACADGRTGRVQIHHFPDDEALAAGLIDTLAAAYDRGVPWHRMAVLLRNPGAEGPGVLRHLSAAGIPVQQEGQSGPLAEQAPIRLLLQAARLAVSGVGRREQEPDVLDLLISPMVGGSWAEVRALQRWLAQHGSCLSEAMSDPQALAEVPHALREIRMQVLGLGTALRESRLLADRQESPARVLWPIWSARFGSLPAWPERLRTVAERGGPESASAHADLDAVTTLFRLAGRQDRHDGTLAGLLAELDRQAIGTQADVRVTTPRDAVHLGSPRTVRGRQWSIVAVCGVNEASWAGGASTNGLIDPGRLTRDGLLPTVAATDPFEDRRLLHTALGRSSEQVWLASAGPDGPSRLLSELGPPVHTHHEPVVPRRSKWQVLRLLRHECLSGDPVRRATASRALRRLVEAVDDQGRLLFPGADPRLWPGARDWSRGPRPVRDPQAPLRMSASGLAMAGECTLRWFLERESLGAPADSVPAKLGTAVHEVVAELIRTDSAGDIHERDRLLSEVWSALEYEAAWHAELERGSASHALERAALWLSQRTGSLRPEHPIEASVAPGVTVAGAVDLLEVLPDGRGIVWDFKTRRSRPSEREVREHVQLGVYQQALAHGGADGVADTAGGGLVHVCVPAAADSPDQPSTRMQSPEQAQQATARAAGVAVDAVRRERFPVTPGTWCRHCSVRAACPVRSGGTS